MSIGLSVNEQSNLLGSLGPVCSHEVLLIYCYFLVKSLFASVFSVHVFHGNSSVILGLP